MASVFKTIASNIFVFIFFLSNDNFFQSYSDFTFPRLILPCFPILILGDLVVFSFEGYFLAPFLTAIRHACSAQMNRFLERVLQYLRSDTFKSFYFSGFSNLQYLCLYMDYIFFRVFTFQIYLMNVCLL